MLYAGVALVFTTLVLGSLLISHVSSKIIKGIQELFDKMKEYDLDTRAGIIFCRGSDLRIHYVDPALQVIIGRPNFIENILPESMRERHRKLIERYVGSQPLQDSLNHPLRNVQILTKEHETMQAKLIIGKVGILRMMDIFYVVVQPDDSHTRLPSIERKLKRTGSWSSIRSAHSVTSNRSKQQDFEKRCKAEEEYLCEDDHDGLPYLESRSTSAESAERDECPGLAELYGVSATTYIDRGLVPAAERYAQATVLYMDIVDFTRQCVAKPLDEISGWMVRIHAAVDELLVRHAVRKVETRGDCVICVSGTNFAPAEGASARDLCSDQATRMLAFAHDLGLALAAIDGTAARMGVATGPVVLTHIAHGGDALPAKYIYGDTVNVACRMEQTGRAGAVQLAESAARAHAAERGAAMPPLRTRDIKGKGPMRVALYDLAAGRFLGPHDPDVRVECPASS